MIFGAHPDDRMRRLLWVSAAFNAIAAVAFAFPASLAGQLAGLPAPVPPIYSALLTLFVLLFGGAYAWLAMQPVIHRPLVGFSAIGKTGVFLIVFAFCLSGTAPARGVLMASGDLLFAAIYIGWLIRTAQRPAPAGAH
jgi:hypothetical protein